MGVFLAVMLQDFLRDLGSEDYDVWERATAARRFRGSLVSGFSGSEADERPESRTVVVPALMEPETEALLRDLGAEDYDVRERATAARRFCCSLVPWFSGSEADDRPESRIVVVLALMEPETEALLRNLGAEEYAVRERATVTIMAMGFERALPILRAAEASRDPEVRARAHWILETVWPDYGIRRGARVVPDPELSPPIGILNCDGDIQPAFNIPTRFFDPDAPGR